MLQLLKKKVEFTKHIIISCYVVSNLDEHINAPVHMIITIMKAMYTHN